MNKMARTWSRDYFRKLKRQEDGQLMELCGGIRGVRAAHVVHAVLTRKRYFQHRRYYGSWVVDRVTE